MLCNNAKVGVSVSFPFSLFFLGGGGGGGCRKNSGCLRGVSKENEGNPGGVYKVLIWTITNSSGPPQVISTDWSLRWAFFVHFPRGAWGEFYKSWFKSDKFQTFQLILPILNLTA